MISFIFIFNVYHSLGAMLEVKFFLICNDLGLFNYKVAWRKLVSTKMKTHKREINKNDTLVDAKKTCYCSATSHYYYRSDD